jgi:sulfur transfer protein SufE
MKSQLNKFKEYLDQFEDDFDRVHAIMDLGESQIPFGQQPDSAVQVPGCQSTLWVWGEHTVCGHWHFYTSGDGLFAAGMGQLVATAVNGHTTQELDNLGPDWFEGINLQGMITSGRMNGFLNLLKVINEIVKE